MRPLDGVKLGVTITAVVVLVALDVYEIRLSAFVAGLLGGIAVKIFPVLGGEQ